MWVSPPLPPSWVITWYADCLCTHASSKFHRYKSNFISWYGPRNWDKRGRGRYTLVNCIPQNPEYKDVFKKTTKKNQKQQNQCWLLHCTANYITKKIMDHKRKKLLLQSAHFVYHCTRVQSQVALDRAIKPIDKWTWSNGKC